MDENYKINFNVAHLFHFYFSKTWKSQKSDYASVFHNIIHIKFHWKRNLTSPHKPISLLSLDYGFSLKQSMVMSLKLIDKTQLSYSNKASNFRLRLSHITLLLIVSHIAIIFIFCLQLKTGWLVVLEQLYLVPLYSVQTKMEKILNLSVLNVELKLNVQPASPLG